MNCAPHKYYYSNKVQGCMMGGARDRDGQEEKYIGDCGGKTCRREFASKT